MRKLLALMFLSFFAQKIYANEMYQVDTDRLNVRINPNPKSSIIGYLTYGVNVEVLDSTSLGWYKIKAKNGLGYVSGAHLKKIITASPKSLTTQYNLKILGTTILFLIVVTICYYLYKSFNSDNKNEKEQTLLQQPNSINQQVIIKRKSVGLAILLCLFLGPFGMFYSTVKGAIVMLLLPIMAFTLVVFTSIQDIETTGILSIVGLITLLFLYIPICCIWAGIAANKTNRIIINFYQP